MLNIYYIQTRIILISIQRKTVYCWSYSNAFVFRRFIVGLLVRVSPLDIKQISYFFIYSTTHQNAGLSTTSPLSLHEYAITVIRSQSRRENLHAVSVVGTILNIAKSREKATRFYILEF
jgi:hypothetical protein